MVVTVAGRAGARCLGGLPRPPALAARTPLGVVVQGPGCGILVGGRLLSADSAASGLAPGAAAHVEPAPPPSSPARAHCGAGECGDAGRPRSRPPRRRLCVLFPLVPGSATPISVGGGWRERGGEPRGGRSRAGRSGARGPRPRCRGSARDSLQTRSPPPCVLSRVRANRVVSHTTWLVRFSTSKGESEIGKNQLTLPTR